MSGDARPRARGARGTNVRFAAALVAAGLLCALVAARASAQESAADSAAIEGAAEADTGWVEIGGSTPFGEDDPFADLPLTSEGDDEEPGARFFPFVDYNRVDALTLGLDHSFKPKKGWLPAISFRFARAFGRLTDGGADHGLGCVGGEGTHNDARRRIRPAGWGGFRERCGGDVEGSGRSGEADLDAGGRYAV